MLVYFVFAFQDLQNSIPLGPPLHDALEHNEHISMLKMALTKPANRDIFFVQKIWYVTCVVPNFVLIPCIKIWVSRPNTTKT